jgi:hypothetical protein
MGGIEYHYEQALKECEALKKLKNRLQELMRASEGVSHSFYWYKTAIYWGQFLEFILSPLVLQKGVTFRNECFIDMDDVEYAVLEFQCNLPLDELLSIMEQVDATGNDSAHGMIETLNYRKEYTGEIVEGRLYQD